MIVFIGQVLKVQNTQSPLLTTTMTTHMMRSVVGQQTHLLDGVLMVGDLRTDSRLKMNHWATDQDPQLLSHHQYRTTLRSTMTMMMITVWFKKRTLLAWCDQSLKPQCQSSPVYQSETWFTKHQKIILHCLKTVTKLNVMLCCFSCLLGVMNQMCQGTVLRYVGCIKN